MSTPSITVVCDIRNAAGDFVKISGYGEVLVPLSLAVAVAESLLGYAGLRLESRIVEGTKRT